MKKILFSITTVFTLLIFATDSELLFYAPFDGTAVAAVAAGTAVPAVNRNLSYDSGVKGEAVRLTRVQKSSLAYELAHNLQLEQGTISLWFKPEWNTVSTLSTDRKNWHTLLATEQPKPRLGSGAIWLWCNGNFPRGDTSDIADTYLIGAEMLESGRWYHVVFTWDRLGSELFVDGRSVGSPPDKFSPLRKNNMFRFYHRDSSKISCFFVGALNAAEQADGLIDELRIYATRLETSRIEKLAREFRAVELILHQRYLPAASQIRLSFSAQGAAGEEYRVCAENGKVLTSGHIDQAGNGSAVLNSLASGIYWLYVKGEKQKFYVLQDKNKLWMTGKEMKLEPVARINPAQSLSREHFVSIGKLRVGQLNQRSYLEAGLERGDRFGIRIQLPDKDSIYLVEWDYPDDKKRTCDILLQSSRLQVPEFELQTGYCAGDEYKNTNDFLTQKAIYFPRNKDITMIFMTARGNAPAAVGEIRVSKIISPLPAAEIILPAPVNGNLRRVGIYYEDPAVNYDFGVSGSAMPELETMIDRLIAYMKYSGQNLFAYPLVWYHGMIGNEYNPRGHADRFWEAFLIKFDTAGLEFMATMNRNSMKVPRGFITPERIENGSLHESAVSILATGKPNPGGWHNTPPNFNILHPDVKKILFDDVKQILDIGEKHPSFKGIILHLPRHSMLWFGDIQAGYNDYVINAFEKDTGIRLPVDRSNPMRGKLYAEYLLGSLREQWIDWRCQKIAKLYCELATYIRMRRSDLRLVINSMIPIPEVSDPRYGEPDFVAIKNREAGLDPRYYTDVPGIVLQQTIYPADYRWRSGQKLQAEVWKRLREIDKERATYELLQATSEPWLHQHDRYWESAIGSTRRAHWSDKPNTLRASWLKEQHWRASTLNPAGLHAMRHYVLPLRYSDLLGITKGGFLIGTHGIEKYLTPFIRAFRALPAKRFLDLPTGAEMVRGRFLKENGFTYFYVVNTSEEPVDIEIQVTEASMDLLSGQLLPKKFLQKLNPYELRSYRTDLNATVKFNVQ